VVIVSYEFKLARRIGTNTDLAIQQL